jgi:hypothetical protein
MKTTFRKHWYLFIPLIIAGFALLGFITMCLWNRLMPAIFHLPEISFWQTIGLMILSRLLLGIGHHGGPIHNGRFRERMYEKWEKMTPEEREKLREQFKHRVSWRYDCCEPEQPKD